MPVGQMGTVQYVLTSVPTTTPSYIQVDFSVSTKGHQLARSHWLEWWGLLLPGLVDALGLRRMGRASFSFCSQYEPQILS